MKKLFSKKYLIGAMIAIFAITLIAGHIGIASAQTAGSPVVNQPPPANQSAAAQTQIPNSSGCSMWGIDPCTAVVNFILYFVNQAMGLLIAIGAWLISIGLALTTTVYSSQATQNGFATTLSIANLAFVLAIIVIAIATILHSETYGYKKALWRLVAMAILVNFGLVITAPIVGFANSMTTYFVNATTNGATTGTNAVVTFSNSLAASTNVAALNGTVPANTTGSNVSVGGAFMQTLMSLLFTIIFDGLIALTFILLGILLFVRYVYLVILLVMLPLAWVAWIFPNFSGQFSAWWKKFIHWTFFPPAAMFFVWLAVNIQTNFANSVNSGNSAAAAIGTIIGQPNAITNGTSATGILAQLINSIIVIGVMIGGLIASSKLADGAGKWAVAQGQAVSGYVGRRAGQAAKRLGTAPLRTQPVKNLAARLQQRSDVGVLRKTGLNWLGRKVGQGAEAAAIAGGSKNVDSSAERFKKMTSGQRLNRITGTEFENAPAQRMALLKQIMEDKNIGKLSADEMERYFGEKEKNTFKRFGQEKLYKDLQEKSGLALKYADEELVKLNKELADLTAAGAPTAEIDKKKSEIKDKKNEKNRLLASYIDENNDVATDAFADPAKLDKRRKEAAATGRIPASLDPATLQRLQKNLAEGIASGLSTQNVSTLMKALAKKNNLDDFKDSFARMKAQAATDPAMAAFLAEINGNYSTNDPILKWNKRSVDRGDLDIDLDPIYSYVRPAPTPTPPRPRRRPTTPTPPPPTPATPPPTP